MPRARRSLLAGLLLGCVIGAAGCETSPYDDRYFYEPRPADITAEAPDGGTIRSLATIVGVRRNVASIPHPATVDVRLRIENDTGGVIRFRPGALLLSSADVRDFPPAEIRPPGVVEIPPGARATIAAYFPFPDAAIPGDFDLSGLNLRWSMEVGDRTLTASATYWRRFWVHRGWPPSYGVVNVGVVF